MYRARSGHVAAAARSIASGPLLSSSRRYTPIYAPDTAEDHLGQIRTCDECKTLWAQHIPVPSLSRAIELWLRFGNDPVVHSSAAALATVSATKATSPFAYVEDYMGTNLVTGSQVQVKESAELWASFFEMKYLRRMRQSRRTSKQYLGVLGGGAAAAEVKASSFSPLAGLFLDEADHPNTTWEKDTFFCEVAYLSERYLKVKPTNFLQLEKALWSGTMGSDAFVAYFEAFQQQTVTRIPLPAPAIYFYEGTDAKKKWSERYLPVCKAAHHFFQEKLKPHAGDATASSKLLLDVAAAYKQVHAILLERRRRQMKVGLCPSTWVANGAASSSEEDVWTSGEIEREQRRIEEGVYDPEDLLDSTPEWAAEHAKIEALLTMNVHGGSSGSYNFTLLEFWLNTERREGLETVHVLETESLARVAAAARRRIYNETAFDDILVGLEESVAKARLDLRAAVLKPHFNSVWCRWNYVKYGAASIVQHTHTASRQLLFHYAASVQEVAATAQLYFATKPLSSHLDYASPYTFRRSLVRHCSQYGVETAHAAQRPFLLSAAHLAKAEDTMGRVARQAAIPFGVRRRARYAAAAANNQRLLTPVKSVCVSPPPPELLDAGADFFAVLREERAATPSGAAESVKIWPLGSRQTVSYEWTTPALEKLRLFGRFDGALTAEQALQREQLRRSGRLEISLWRRRTAEERQRIQREMQAEAAEVEVLQSEFPGLREVFAYATDLYAHLTREQHNGQSSSTPTDSSAVSPQSEMPEVEEWTFAVMLDDNVPLSETQSTEVFLPYTDALGNRLPNGEYRVVVRAIDRELNPTEHPTLISEAVSANFSVVDALPQLYAQYTQRAAAGQGAEVPLEGEMAGSELIAFCAYLRAAGLIVPLSAEFAMGQSLDKDGNFSVAEMAMALRGPAYHRSQSERGITDSQRTIEPRCRFHWSLYHPGSNDQEWASARRRVLQAAMMEERDWWMPDPMLEVVDVRTDSASAPSLRFDAYSALARYGTELCTVLSAQGSNYMEYAVLPPSPGISTVATSGGAQVQADCTVDGTGALVSLHYGAPVSSADITVKDALGAALEAIQVAQMRHSTLSMVRLGDFDKQTQTMVFCGVHGLEFGGKYARTYAYALEKAKRELMVTAEVGRVASVRARDAETVRVSEQEQSSSSIDRYASKTNPEQRLTRFVPRVTPHSYSMEDLAPDQTSTWGQ